MTKNNSEVALYCATGIVQYASSVEAMLERVEGRRGRPNPRPIRATSCDLPDVLSHTVERVEQHGSGVLIWLKQTHRAKNAWKAFGHLFRCNAPARDSRLR